MKLRNSVAIAALAVAFIAYLAFVRGKGSVAFTVEEPARREQTQARSGTDHHPKASTAAAQSLTLQEFATRFRLNGTAEHELLLGIARVARNLMEIKGVSAKSTVIDSRTIRIEVPALNVTDEALDELVLKELSVGMDVAKAAMIWSDAEGRATILKYMGWKELIADANFVIVRTRDEDVAKPADLGYANFRVECTFTRNGVTDPALGKSVWNDLNFTEAPDIGLGRTGMSKAPPGFFVSEAVLKKRSPGQPFVEVVQDLDTGKTVVTEGVEPKKFEVR